jgi:TetR/AcrR family transcriptional regulator, cholesterol catabolism regulator
MDISLHPDEGPRSKRVAILAAAIDCFGESGYEHTKWSEVAKRVGIGQTALYHYFESKAHCLLTIMRMELERSRLRFVEATRDVAPQDALKAAVRAAYTVTDREMLQMRILQSHMALLSTPRASEKEEAERLASRALVHKIEVDWTSLLEAGMADGSFVREDPQMMAQLMLGSIVSVWRWYRPQGPMTLSHVSRFVEGCCLRMVAPPVKEPRTRKAAALAR